MKGRSAKRRLTPITRRQLEAIERGQQIELVQRLCHTLKESWNQIEAFTPQESTQDQTTFDEGRIPVLIVTHANGAFEVYSPRGELSVKVVAYPNVDDATPEIADKCERIVELNAGRRHAQLYLPEYLNMRGAIDKSSLVEMIELQERVSFVREVLSIGGK